MHPHHQLLIRQVVSEWVYPWECCQCQSPVVPPTTTRPPSTNHIKTLHNTVPFLPQTTLHYLLTVLYCPLWFIYGIKHSPDSVMQSKYIMSQLYTHTCLRKMFIQGNTTQVHLLHNNQRQWTLRIQKFVLTELMLQKYYANLTYLKK